MSAEMITNPVWQIFTPEQIDLSTVEKEWVEYREINVTNLESLTKLEIETRDKDSFILPHEGYLEARFKITQNDAVLTAIPATDKVALQNNALSMFKNIEYLIEDQRIEYLDEPGLSFTVKNLADFSKQYGESIASNQHFYIDTQEGPTTPNCNVRFFNNTAPRVGVELFFVQDNANCLRPNIPPNPDNAPPRTTGFWDGDSVVAYTNVTSVVAGGVNGAVTGTPIIFYTLAGATSVKTAHTLSIDTTANGSTLLVSVGAADGTFLGAYNGETGAPVNFFRNDTVLLTNSIPINVLLVTIPGGVQNSIFSANIVMQDSYNTGFTKRQALAAQSNLVSVWIPFKDMFLFCRAYDKISRGLRHRIVLNKQSDKQMLYRFGGTDDRKLSISYISAWIPRLKPNLETLKMVESKLISNELMYTVNFTDLTYWRTPTALSGQSSGSAYQLTTTTKKPIRVWVAFQNTTRINDSQTINKRIFDHLNTTAIQVRLNGKIFPLYEYKFGDNFTNYNRAYTAFMNSGYKMADHSDGSLITYEMFKALYPIFYFDLTAQEEDLYKANKYAEIEIRFSNGAPPTANYHMHVIYESERVIKFRGIGGSMALEV